MSERFQPDDRIVKLTKPLTDEYAELKYQWSDAVLRSRKVVSYLPVSDEVPNETITHIGLWSAATASPPLRTRARLRIALWRIRLGEIVAGQRFDEF